MPTKLFKARFRKGNKKVRETPSLVDKLLYLAKEILHDRIKLDGITQGEIRVLKHL